MRLKIITIPLLVFGLFSALLLSVADPTPVSATCTSNFFGLPAWYDGLLDGNCSVRNPVAVGGLSTFIWRIALNVIEAFMVIVAYTSVVMLIVGGYKYMIATGAPDKVKAAKDTIRNAIVGLVIALGSVAIVNVIAGAL